MEDGTMDAMNRLLKSVRVRRATWECHELTAPFAIPRAGAGLHFIAVSDGGCHLDLADHAPVVCGPGAVVALPHGGDHVIRQASEGPHGLTSQRPTANLVLVQLQLGHAEVPPALRVLPSSVRLANDPMTHWLVTTLISTTRCSAQPAAGSTAIAERLAEVLCVQLFRSGFPSTPETQALLRGLADPQLAKALSLIHKSPGSGWTVTSLAGKVGMSRSAFAARFSSLVGVPPLHYLGHVRMQQAADLLSGDGMALGDIAAVVGYESDAAFSKAFKRHFGRAPGAFRRAARVQSSATGCIPSATAAA